MVYLYGATLLRTGALQKGRSEFRLILADTNDYDNLGLVSNNLCLYPAGFYADACTIHCGQVRTCFKCDNT